jgi:hypothetical protein
LIASAAEASHGVFASAVGANIWKSQTLVDINLKIKIVLG